MTFRFLITLAIVCNFLPLSAQDETNTLSQPLSFKFNDLQYDGFLDLPKSVCKGIIVLIPGSGKTDFKGTGGFATFFQHKRKAFLDLGYGVLGWDKAGCGDSEGIFQEDQSIVSSRDEALAAIGEIQRQNVPGSDHIGLWGMSRGGWICLMVIEQMPSISFWISVSGTDQYDNYQYLLETNFKIEGREQPLIDTLIKQWDFHMKAIQTDTIPYTKYLGETEKLYSDPFFLALGQKRPTSSELEHMRAYMKRSDNHFDKQTGLRIMVSEFENILSKINCPVLAIFGEKDSQINWQKTKALYERTIGKADSSSLSIISIPNCNHLLMKCRTGGMFENLDDFKYELCDEYYPEMIAWLDKL